MPNLIPTNVSGYTVFSLWSLDLCAGYSQSGGEKYHDGRYSEISQGEQSKCCVEKEREREGGRERKRERERERERERDFIKILHHHP